MSSTSTAEHATAPPLCHVFRHRGRWFAYDAFSNRLLGIDAAVAKLLSGRFLSPPAMVRRGAAWRQVLDARRQGLLLPVNPRLGPPARDEEAESGWTVEHLTLTVSEECNLRCRYCLHDSTAPWIRPHRPRAMSRRTALRAVATFLERCHPRTQPVISFYGGEPLLNLPVIRAVARYVASHPRRDEVQLVVDTNGTRLGGAAALVQRHRLYLQISMDGPAPSHDRYRRTRGGRPTHRHLENVLHRLLSADPGLAQRLRIQVTLVPDTDLEAVDAYFANFPPFRRLGLPGSPPLGVSTADLTGLPLASTLTAPAVRRWWREQLTAARERFVSACRRGQREELGPVTRALFEPRLVRWHHRRRGSPPAAPVPAGCCRPGVHKLHVRADGRLQPCERVGETMILGDVEQWVDPVAVRELWNRFLAATGERCATCWAFRLCDLCFAVLAPTWERQPAPPLPEAACRRVRQRLEETMRLYLDLKEGDGAGTAWLRHTMVV